MLWSKGIVLSSEQVQVSCIGILRISCISSAYSHQRRHSLVSLHHVSFTTPHSSPSFSLITILESLPVLESPEFTHPTRTLPLDTRYDDRALRLVSGDVRPRAHRRFSQRMRASRPPRQSSILSRFGPVEIPQTRSKHPS